jgi:cyclohexadienyl dehydratase
VKTQTMLRWLVLTTLGLVSHSLAYGATADSVSSSSHLSQLINARLGYMKDVAAYKWINNIAIEDLAREQKVIEAAQNSGLRSHLTMVSSRQFFALQIEAAKEIQHYWFKQWQEGPEPDRAPDLVNEVRPRLIELGNDIVQALALPQTSEQLAIEITGLSLEAASQLQAAAGSMKFYPNQLDQILSSKKLRVGTTLDYAPFSYEQAGQPSGIDLDLAADLAISLDAELVLVNTSWPTLMADLTAGKFDIGMSGISLNLERQKSAYFSLPHHTGGKTAIVRCDQVSRFNELSKIDQPDTRVIVNPGGTNQRFVQSNVRQAAITVHPDNRTIFDEIIEHRADVMITDAIEVELQSALHSELCGATPGQTFTFQQKGFLLPRDQDWKQFVDAWLTQRIGEGVVKQAFSQHLAN